MIGIKDIVITVLIVIIAGGGFFACSDKKSNIDELATHIRMFTDHPVTRLLIPPDAGQEKIVVSCSDIGEIKINMASSALGRLGGELQRIYSERSDKNIFISPNCKLPYGDIVRIIDIAFGAGVQAARLITGDDVEAQNMPVLLSTIPLERQEHLNLPRARNQFILPEADMNGDLVISLNRTGQIHRDVTPLSEGQLFGFITQQFSSSEIRDRMIYLQADTALPYGRVAEIVKGIRDAGGIYICLMVDFDK